MDFTCKTRAVSSFAKEMQKGKYNTHHKLQRKEGQWSNRQRGELIDSLLRSYPIDPIRCEVKDDGIFYIFDGVQRSTNICSFLNGDYSLPRNLKPVMIDDKEYEIAGKKFAKLDEAVQDKIRNSEIQVYLFTNCTDEDIREMYRRQNNGKSLSNTQKRTAIESDQLSDIVFTLADHPFFDKILTKTQLKRDVSRDLIRETLMLIETNDENDFTSFSAKSIDGFLLWYADKINTDKTAILEQALDKFDELISDIKLPVSSIPMILYCGYKVLRDKKSFTKLVEIVTNFASTYDENEEYKQLSSQGTTGRANVRGRFDYWRNLIKTA